MGRDKKITCRKCFRVMRKDNLKRHMERHENENYQNETICSSSITSSTTTLNKESNISLDTAKTKTLKIALGKEVDEILGRGKVKQAALSKDMHGALCLYRHSINNRRNVEIDTDN